MLKLGVNIDHIATLREARYRNMPAGEPSPLTAAKLCLQTGAHSITAHLREDRRHIQENDVLALKRDLSAPLNLEMAVTEPMIAFARNLKPDEVCLVPENRQEVTTEGGLAVAGYEKKISSCVANLSQAGIRVSLFIDPDEAQVRSSAQTGAPCIELHTGRYANASTPAEKQSCLQSLASSAKLAHSLGLQVNAGHGLSAVNLPDFLASVPHLDTLNIGHSIISRAVFVGLPASVQEVLNAMRGYNV